MKKKYICFCLLLERYCCVVAKINRCQKASLTDRRKKNSVEIDLTGNSAECTSKAVEVSEGKVRITDEGTYTLSGTLEGSVIIDASNTDKVELILKMRKLTALTLPLFMCCQRIRLQLRQRRKHKQSFE